jgi:hypothetical protein
MYAANEGHEATVKALLALGSDTVGGVEQENMVCVDDATLCRPPLLTHMHIHPVE